MQGIFTVSLEYRLKRPILLYSISRVLLTSRFLPIRLYENTDS
jgi:hypothetical protein